MCQWVLLKRQSVTNITGKKESIKKESIYYLQILKRKILVQPNDC